MTAQPAQDKPQPAKRHRSRKYSSEPLVALPDTASLGPAMRELTVMQRKFCYELHSGPSGYGSLIRAAKAAGYGSSDSVVSVKANQLLHDDKVQAALRSWGTNGSMPQRSRQSRMSRPSRVIWLIPNA